MSTYARPTVPNITRISQTSKGIKKKIVKHQSQKLSFNSFIASPVKMDLWRLSTSMAVIQFETNIASYQRDFTALSSNHFLNQRKLIWLIIDPSRLVYFWNSQSWFPTKLPAPWGQPRLLYAWTAWRWRTSGRTRTSPGTRSNLLFGGYKWLQWWLEIQVTQIMGKAYLTL